MPRPVARWRCGRPSLAASRAAEVRHEAGNAASRSSANSAVSAADARVGISAWRGARSELRSWVPGDVTPLASGSATDLTRSGDFSTLHLDGSESWNPGGIAVGCLQQRCRVGFALKPLAWHRGSSLPEEKVVGIPPELYAAGKSVMGIELS
ncbi:UNVERIFIED_CONTAM: hypothetical protein K2H54_035174 [Gekko kuhli]